MFEILSSYNVIYNGYYIAIAIQLYTASLSAYLLRVKVAVIVRSSPFLGTSGSTVMDWIVARDLASELPIKMVAEPCTL